VACGTRVDRRPIGHDPRRWGPCELEREAHRSALDQGELEPTLPVARQDIAATLDAFASLDQVPPGYWPIIVRDELPMRGVIGIHLDERGQPFSLVRHTPSWSLTASHEALEMLVDPFGNRLMPGGSPLKGQGMVDFLVEVCDPCGGPRFAYTVNGVLVSDFITPHFYDPVTVAGVRYSYSGALERPRGILPGGYLVWREPTSGEWWKWDFVGRKKPRFASLGLQPNDQRPLRERVDEQGGLDVLYDGLRHEDPRLAVARARHESSRAASRAYASGLHDEIDRLIRGAPAAESRDDPARRAPPAGHQQPRLSQNVTSAPLSRASFHPRRTARPVRWGQPGEPTSRSSGSPYAP
jgi:hypothetical protein